MYHSTAVFLREEESKREFLFFGDVEPGAFLFANAPVSLGLSTFVLCQRR